MAWDRDKEREAGKKMAIAGSVFGLVFILFWCYMAYRMGAGFMLIFAIPFAGILGYRLYIMLQKSKEDTKKPTSRTQPMDPWDQPAAPRREQPAGQNGYCPYCGSAVDDSFSFCPKCGRTLH